jgi:hypothetical protein
MTDSSFPLLYNSAATRKHDIDWIQYVSVKDNFANLLGEACIDFSLAGESRCAFSARQQQGILLLVTEHRLVSSPAVGNCFHTDLFRKAPDVGSLKHVPCTSTRGHLGNPCVPQVLVDGGCSTTLRNFLACLCGHLYVITHHMLSASSVSTTQISNITKRRS